VGRFRTPILSPTTEVMRTAQIEGAYKQGAEDNIGTYEVVTGDWSKLHIYTEELCNL
jgi:hypothetical protein